MKNRVLSLAAAAVLAAPLASHAAPVTYDFTVNGGTSGPLANVTSSGSFTFDSSIIPAGVLLGALAIVRGRRRKPVPYAS